MFISEGREIMTFPQHHFRTKNSHCETLMFCFVCRCQVRLNTDIEHVSDINMNIMRLSVKTSCLVVQSEV